MLRPAFRRALLAPISLLPAPLLAQDDAADGEVGNTIIVTAQKIDQRVEDVPITISAVTSELIRELAVSDLDELSNYVPGLNIQEQSANNPGVVIRGITSDSGSAQEGPRVTLYYNGVDISRSRGSYQAIYDLDRVEVIKGPQATLFGTASAVGAISIISARPEEGFSGEITGGFGNFDQRLLTGHINAGSDVIAGRFAFEWRKRDGYTENLAPSQEEELYAQDQLGLRGSLRFTPDSDLTIDLIGTYDQQRNSGTPFVSGTFPAFAGAPGGADNAFGDANLGGSPFSAEALGDDQLGLNREVYDLNLTTEWAISDAWTFTAVNGYRKFDSAEVFDADGSAAPFLEFAEIASGDQFSHEGRFGYTGANLRGSFGWNYFTEDGRQAIPFSTEEGIFLQCLTALTGNPQIVPGIACVAPDGSVPAAAVTGIATSGAATAIPYRAEIENQGRNDSYSVFADATLLVGDALELTAGLRYAREKRRSGYFADVPDSVLSGASLIPGQLDTAGQTFTANESYDSFLPRFNILYRISPELNAYATVAKGRRSPVVQLSAESEDGVVVPDLQLVPEETVWNYEGGLKLASGAVSASLGVYYQVYDSFQVSVAQLDGEGNPTGIFNTESAGSASNLGVEAEIVIAASDWLRLFANAGYIDGGIDENSAFDPLFAGARFRLQPEWQAAAGFTVDYPIGNGARLFATPSITHRSRIFFEVPNDRLISQEPVTLVNARAGISFDDDRFELAAFIRNAFDEDYLLDAGNTGGSFGIPTFIPAEPRLFGIQLTARFGK